jgi:cytochrome P450
MHRFDPCFLTTMRAPDAMPGCRYIGLSVRESLATCDVDIGSVEVAKALLSRRRPLRYGPMVALMRSALRHRVMIVADGEAWQRSHDAIIPQFRAATVARDHAPVIASVAEEVFAGLAKGADAVTIEVEPVMRTITSSVMSHVMFGKTLATADAGRLERLLNAATAPIRTGPCARVNEVLARAFGALKLAAWQPVAIPSAQRKAIEALLSWITCEVDRAELAGIASPLLQSLRERYAGLNRKEQTRRIAAEYAMLLIAGIETTAATLTFAVAEIANNPAIRDAVAMEARRQVGCSPSAGSSENLPLTHPYLHKVVREALRRHTIVPTMLRQAGNDCGIVAERPGSTQKAIVKVRRGSALRYLPFRDHMRASVWSEPYAFHPERFDRLTPEQKRSYHPFGFGPQSCPGQSMATTECILILQVLCRRFDVETKALTHAIPVQRNVMFTIRPVGVTVRIAASGDLTAPGADASCQVVRPADQERTCRQAT